MGAAAGVCTSWGLQVLTVTSLPVVSLLINESGKDFINTHITVIPICYELNRLWKVGFGNAFHMLNRPRPDQLWE